MRLLPVGEEALLAEVGSVEEATALYGAARSAELAVDEVVPAARTVLFDGIRDRAGLQRWLARLDLPTASRAVEDRVPVVLPTRYDGEDLDDVSRSWDMTRAEVVATHTGTRFTVAFCGFAPGFPYLRGLPEAWAVPRLAAPRPRVPAGSVGLADGYCGIYPSASPGGWRLVGRTGQKLFDVRREPPALLGPGTRVRLVPV